MIAPVSVTQPWRMRVIISHTSTAVQYINILWDMLYRCVENCFPNVLLPVISFHCLPFTHYLTKQCDHNWQRYHKSFDIGGLTSLSVLILYKRTRDIDANLLIMKRTCFNTLSKINALKDDSGSVVQLHFFNIDETKIFKLSYHKVYLQKTCIEYHSITALFI